jgi:hypothetical protein
MPMPEPEQSGSEQINARKLGAYADVAGGHRHEPVGVIAFDTPLLARSFSEIADYTSTQLLSAVTAQLFRFDRLRNYLHRSACVAFSRNKEATKYTLNIGSDIRFAEGEPVVAAHFELGLREVLMRTGPAFLRLNTIYNIAATKPDGATQGGGSLTITLQRPDFQLTRKLAHPAFSPCRLPQIDARKWDGAGPFVLVKESQTGGTLHRRSTPSSRRAITELRYNVIEDPEEALEAYLLGLIDRTCPALHCAKSLAKMQGHPDFVRLPSNTFLALFPCSPRGLDPALRTFLHRAIDRGLLEVGVGGSISAVQSLADLEPNWPHTKAASRTRKSRKVEPQLFPGCHLRIAYDPFPPNREVLAALAEQLSPFGISIDLLQDNFVTPNVACDMRLVVLVNSHAYPLDAYCMIGATPAVQQNRKLRDLWWAAIGNYDAAESTEERQSALKYLDELIEVYVPILLLSRLNQFALRRAWLRRFDPVSDISWERL